MKEALLIEREELKVVLANEKRLRKLGSNNHNFIVHLEGQIEAYNRMAGVVKQFSKELKEAQKKANTRDSVNNVFIAIRKRFAEVFG